MLPAGRLRPSSAADHHGAACPLGRRPFIVPRCAGGAKRAGGWKSTAGAGIGAAAVIGVITTAVVVLLWALNNGTSETVNVTLKCAVLLGLERVIARMQQEYDVRLAKLQSDIADKATRNTVDGRWRTTEQAFADIEKKMKAMDAAKVEHGFFDSTTGRLVTKVDELDSSVRSRIGLLERKLGELLVGGKFDPDSFHARISSAERKARDVDAKLRQLLEDLANKGVWEAAKVAHDSDNNIPVRDAASNVNTPITNPQPEAALAASVVPIRGYLDNDPPHLAVQPVASSTLLSEVTQQQQQQPGSISAMAGNAANVDCKDVDAQCGSWAAAGECDKNLAWMTMHCAKSCNRCETAAKAKRGDPSDTCKDKETQCPGWAQLGQCDTNRQWMIPNCPLSCGQCLPAAITAADKSLSVILQSPVPCGPVCAVDAAPDEDDDGQVQPMEKSKFHISSIKKDIQCTPLFQRASAASSGAWPALLKIPDSQASLLDAFTLQGRVQMQYATSAKQWARLYGSKEELKTVTWARGRFDALKEAMRKGSVAPTDSPLPTGYEQIVEDLRAAFKLHSVKGLSGAVFGSEHLEGGAFGDEHPWVEALTLVAGGAKEITSFNERPIFSNHPEVKTSTFQKLTSAYLDTSQPSPSFDFIVAIGSVPHAGLGRFGEALNPFGDLEAVARARCLLRPGGLLFIGVPTATQDKVIFNMQRVYGPARLPHLASGWEHLDKIGADSWDSKHIMSQVFVWRKH